MDNIYPEGYTNEHLGKLSSSEMCGVCRYPNTYPYPVFISAFLEVCEFYLFPDQMVFFHLHRVLSFGTLCPVRYHTHTHHKIHYCGEYRDYKTFSKANNKTQIFNSHTNLTQTHCVPTKKEIKHLF